MKKTNKTRDFETRDARHKPRPVSRSLVSRVKILTLFDFERLRSKPNELVYKTGNKTGGARDEDVGRKTETTSPAGFTASTKVTGNAMDAVTCDASSQGVCKNWQIKQSTLCNVDGAEACCVAALQHEEGCS